MNEVVLAAAITTAGGGVIALAVALLQRGAANRLSDASITEASTGFAVALARERDRWEALAGQAIAAIRHHRARHVCDSEDLADF